jgi:serine/threonine protein kinase
MLAKYKKQKLLSEAETGAVWLVIDQTGKEYTAKLVNPKYEGKFIKQLPILKSIKNSRLVQYVDGFKDKDTYVVIMEYCESNVH